MIYLLQINLCWAIFYALYWLFYRQETFFRANRFFLIFTLLLGLVLPLDVAQWFSQSIDEQNIVIVYLQEFVVGTQQTGEKIQAFSIDYKGLLILAYFVGCAVVLLRFLFGLKKLYYFYTQSEKEKKEGYTLVKTQEVHLPFSFMGFVFWSQLVDNEEDERYRILMHEVAHVRQRHSFDVLFVELLNIVFWCSPVLYLYKKSLRAVHEYLADEAATTDFSKREYGTLLIRQSQSGMQLAIANSFIHSQLKQRFAMMLKPSSPRVAYLKYAFCTPIVLILSYFLHQQSVEAQKVKIDPYGVKITMFDNFDVTESIDTIVTFDPSTFKESVQIVTSTDTIYKNVDKNATFMYGQDSLMRFLARNVKYPKEAREKNISGKSAIRFKVNPRGWVSNVELLKSAGNTLLDTEALRVVSLFVPEEFSEKTAPSWTPAAHKGKNVSTYFVLPIAFRLEGDNGKK
jgi:bla regulator protein blaR1